jgi:predicted metal-dependent hydrolase
VPKNEYKLVRTRRLSGSISIRIKNGEVIASAPFWVPKIAVDSFVKEKADWIEKSLKSQKPVEAGKKYITGETHLLFGKEYLLEVVTSVSPIRTIVKESGNKLVVEVYVGFNKEKLAKEIQDAMLRFYLEKGIGYLTEKVNFYTSLLGVDYSKIEIKKVSSIWGSCSAKNVLSFNRKLVMAPEDIIDYVIIHEVCHLRERNHSSRFWGLVFRFDRKYKEHRRWLHINHAILSL